MKLRTKLFLAAILSMGSLCALALFAAQRLSLHSFSDYVRAQQEQEAQQLIIRLVNAAQKAKDPETPFAEVLLAPWDWRLLRLIPPDLNEKDRTSYRGKKPPPRHRGPPPHMRKKPDGPPPHLSHKRREGRPPPPDGEHPRFQLYSADKTALGRPPKNQDNLIWWEIADNDTLYGWLSANSTDVQERPLDKEFRNSLFQGAVLIALVALGLASLFAFALSNSFRRPLVVLAEGSKKVANGEIPKDLPTERADEFGILARAFEEMCESLTASKLRERQWVADVAHELRTPLAVLQGELEAIQDGVRVANNDSIRSLTEETLHLGNIVNDLHLISIAEAGSLPLSKSETSLNNLFNTIEERFHQRLASKELELKFDIASEIMANIDQRRITQVISNLLENTVRYAHKGIVKISVSKSKEFITIVVEDSGPGIPNDKLAMLFNRFYRVDEARSRQEGGSGLGLSICKSIVEAHGGRIGAFKSSIAQEGLQIKITLPID